MWLGSVSGNFMEKYRKTNALEKSISDLYAVGYI